MTVSFNVSSIDGNHSPDNEECGAVETNNQVVGLCFNSDDKQARYCEDDALHISNSSPIVNKNRQDFESIHSISKTIEKDSSDVISLNDISHNLSFSELSTNDFSSSSSNIQSQIKESITLLKQKQKKHLKKLIRTTKNWFDGVPTEKLSNSSNFDKFILSSSFSSYQLSEFSSIKNSSTCSHINRGSISTSLSKPKHLSNSDIKRETTDLHENNDILRTIELLNCDKKFCSNEVYSAKYNLFTFIPKNLYEQFHRFANIYFLLLVVLQFIPMISTYNPMLSAAPLLTILIATGLKDGIEDLRRHRADQTINETDSIILEPYLDEMDTFVKKQSKWKNIQVGDFIFLKNGDSIPADCIALNCSSLANEIFLDTMSLDGETNLKLKKQIFIQLERIFERSVIIKVERPSPHLHSFYGKLIVSLPSSSTNSETEGSFSQEIILSHENLLFRGCILKDTDWVAAIVIYTGHETKIMLNSLSCHDNLEKRSHSNTETNYTSERAPSKRSTIERQLNRQIVLNFLLLLILCIICMVVEAFSSPSTRFLSGTTSFISVIMSFFSSLILFQTIVPIALYVTVEVCKTCHAFLIHSDLDMKDQSTGQLCNSRAWNLSDDLGRIQFIFTDKTGTLTKNMMIFKYLCVRGQVFVLKDINLLSENMPENSKTCNANVLDSYFYRQIMLTIALCHTVLPSKTDCKLNTEAVLSDPSNDKISLYPPKENSHTINQNSFTEKASYLFGMDQPIYTGESPDEVALVAAGAKMGYQFIGISSVLSVGSKYKRMASVAILDGFEDFFKVHSSQNEFCPSKRTFSFDEYEILLTIPFSSERQRMSVIVQNKEKIYLLCKGSDSVIYSRCCKSSLSSNTWMQDSLDCIDNWASQGLRILCFAMKELSENIKEFNTWMTEYEVAKLSNCPNSSVVLDFLFSRLENDLEFLGATAIEDALQDNVLETIQAFREARICTWILTGDKAETAINVSTSAGLITSSMKLLRVRSPMSNFQDLNFSPNRNSKSSSLNSVITEDIHEAENRSSTKSCALSECAVRSSLLDIIENTFTDSNLNNFGGALNGKTKHLNSKSSKRSVTEIINGSFYANSINNPIGFGTDYIRITSPVSICIPNSPKSCFSLTAVPLPNLTTSSRKSILGLSPKSILSTHYQATALIVDGQALKYIFDSQDASLRFLFLSMALRCSSVICCRVAPLQKAKVIGLVKEFLSSAVCLAVGDGANDVSMLRKADIGIGISTGKEGCQAVMAADYSITQFSHLKRLLFVHGRWSYHRISSATLCCFYKNIAFVFVLFWYQFDCGFSSQFVYDYSFMLFYNLLFSVLPILSLGIFDRDIEGDVAMLFPCMYTGGNNIPKCTLSHPHSHIENKLDADFSFDPIFKPISYYSIGRFLTSIGEGIYQSLVCYLIPRFIYSGSAFNSLFLYSSSGAAWIPFPEDRTVVGSTMAFSIIISVNLTLLLNHYLWSLISISSVLISISTLFGMFFIMSSWSTSTLYGTPWILFSQPVFYFCLLCCIILCLAPRFVIGYLLSIYKPTSMDILNRALQRTKSLLQRNHATPI